MNSLERISAAVRFEEPDRVPVIPQVFGHAGVLSGVSLDTYVQDGGLIASSQMKALEKYRYDAVFSVMDVNVETEALGSVLNYRKDQYPFVRDYAFRKDSTGKIDWSTVSEKGMPEPEQAGRMPEMLKALRILRRELREEYLIVGCVMGPLTLASQLLGSEATLYLAIDYPDELERLIDFSTEIMIRFGVAQIQAGAHLPIVFDPFASPAVIPYSLFREFELPRLKKAFEAFKQAGALANWLHIAGPVQTILPFYLRTGVDIANFDYCVTSREAQSRLPQVCLNGNLKSLSFVEDDPGDIKAEASALVRSFASRRGFILSSGCEIPPESKPENIFAIVEASRCGE